MKLLVPELGSEDLRAAAAEAQALAASRLVYVEARGVLGRLRADARGQARDLDAAMRLFDRYWPEIGVTELDDAVARTAADIAQRLLIRGADAVHLASALQVGQHGPVVFATWDVRLAAAASSEGLATLPAR